MNTLEATQLNNEASVVGSFCVDAACFGVIERTLAVGDFAQTQAKTAYQAALRLRECGKPIDPVAIADALGDGGAEYIANCMKAVPSAANIELYCEGVLNNSKRRRLLELADNIVSNSYDASIDPDDMLDGLRNELDRVKSNSGSIVSASTAVEEWRRYYLAVKSDPESAYCKTGFSDLDWQLGGGLFRQGLYIVGARPGMGKTTLALNIAENIAKRGKAVLFVSLEMSRVQILSKRIAIEALLGYTELMTGRLSEAGERQAAKALDRIKSRPFALTDKGALTSAEIMRAAKSVDNLQAIVVDYLGLVRPSEEAQKKPRYEQMTEISAGLKAMAKALDVPVLALAQLNRESAKDKSKPKLTDLRDSGAIEQDADAVILLHRKDYYEATKEDYQAPETEEIELIVAKNRHANTGVVKMAWNGKSGRIGEYDTAHAEPQIFTEVNSADELPF